MYIIFLKPVSEVYFLAISYCFNDISGELKIHAMRLFFWKYNQVILQKIKVFLVGWGESEKEGGGVEWDLPVFGIG